MLLVTITIIGTCLSAFVALMALLKNPTSKLHRWLFGFIIMACLWVLSVNVHSIFPLDTAIWLLRIAFLSVGVASFCMLQFVRSLVEGAAARPRWPEILELLLVAGLSLSPYDIAGAAPESASSSFLIPDRGWAYPIVIAVTLALIVQAFYLLVRQIRRVRGRIRVQFMIVFLGLGVGTVLGVTTNVVLPNILRNTFPSRFAFIAVAIWTVVLVYAVVKHRFLDIRLAVVRALGYLLALIAVAVAYILLVFFVLSAFLGNEAIPLRTSLLVYDGILVVFVALTFHSLTQFFDKATRRVFYRDAYDSQIVLDSISKVFTRTVDLGELVSESLGSLRDATKASSVHLVLPAQGHHDQYEYVLGQSKAADKLLAFATKLPEGSMIINDELMISSATLAEQMEKLDVAVVTRLVTSSGQLGYAFFGYKTNGSIFTSQDLDLIRLSTDGLAIAVQNALRFSEIQQFNQTLQARIEEATRELKASNVKLQALDEAKDEFISMASHQLRTPLTSVKGYLSMVLEGDGGELQTAQRDLLRQAFSSAQRMVYLIGDFLNVSRLKTGKFTIEKSPTDLARLVLEEIKQLRPTADARHLRLRYEGPEHLPEFELDQNKLRQVVMNFIDNAIYYSSEHSEIEITLLMKGHDLVFRVRDHGIGVPRAEQHHIFTKFYRATNARKVRPDGTGIGVFMARKVILAHHGTVMFESVEGHGSTFGFTLPIRGRSPSEK